MMSVKTEEKKKNLAIFPFLRIGCPRPFSLPFLPCAAEIFSLPSLTFPFLSP